MSVLIKGLKMPTNCKSCRFHGFGGIRDELNVCMFTGQSQLTLSPDRMSECPLIEIQPHGRLIDADLLKTKYHWTDDFYETVYVEAEDIDDAPTIIPAEEGIE